MVAAELKLNVIFPVIDHMTISHTLLMCLLFSCICDHVGEWQNMDAICCSDVSDIVFVILELTVFISGWDFKMTVALLNSSATVIYLNRLCPRLFLIGIWLKTNTHL